MIPLTNHDSSEGEQWGRFSIYPDISNVFHICYQETHGNGSLSSVYRSHPPFFLSHPHSMVPMMWVFSLHPPWFTGLILSPKPCSTIPSLERRRLRPIQHALYQKIPCFPTCDFHRRYLKLATKIQGKPAWNQKKNAWQLHGFQPRFSQQTPTEKPVFVGNSASCQAAHRTIDLGLQAAALMEIHIAQAELVRLGGKVRDIFPGRRWRLFSPAGGGVKHGLVENKPFSLIIFPLKAPFRPGIFQPATFDY